MTYRTSSKFWDRYYKLPSPVQTLASKNFQLLKENLHHPSLKLKRLDTTGDWSVHIGPYYRALGRDEGGGVVVWYWIGSHEDYNALFTKSRKVSVKGSYYGLVVVEHWTTGEPVRVPIYVDPSPEDVVSIKNIKFPPNIIPHVRFLADRYRRKVYVWHSEIGAYHKDVARKLDIPYESSLKGLARIRSGNTLKATEISGIQRNPADWEWVEKHIEGITKVMERS